MQLQQQIRRAIQRVPPFTSPLVRKGVLRGVRRARWARAQVAAAAGSDRYSAPAALGMDRYVADIAGTGGFFIEAGANDGYRISNTYLLERHHGWTGLLVEPIPHLYAACARRRKRSLSVQCALVAPDFTEPTVSIQYADLNSAIGGQLGDANWGLERSYDLEVPARTLTSLLDEMKAPRPDLLSLDVEGYEAQALAGLDLTRYAPRYILVEVWDRDLAKFGADFEARYEPVEWFSHKDVLLRHR